MLKHADPTIHNFLWMNRSMALGVAFGHHMLGCALVHLGEPELALEKLRTGRDQAEMLSNNAYKSMTLHFEAQALSLLGNHDEAIDHVDEALSVVEATDERWWEADIHRARGEIFQRMNGDAGECEASFRQSEASSSSQKPSRAAATRLPLRPVRP